MSDFDLIACFTRHGKKCGLNQDAIAECCKKAHRAYARYLFQDASQNRAGKPRRKSHRNQMYQKIIKLFLIDIVLLSL
jgi:hypothetical protein